jgi:predicted small secreted protein
MRKTLLSLLAALSLSIPMLLAGCNTIQGAGADVESAGKALKNEAGEHKHY